MRLQRYSYVYDTCHLWMVTPIWCFHMVKSDDPEMICSRHPFYFESHMKLNINILKQFIHFLPEYSWIPELFDASVTHYFYRLRIFALLHLCVLLFILELLCVSVVVHSSRNCWSTHDWLHLICCLMFGFEICQHVNILSFSFWFPCFFHSQNT